MFQINNKIYKIILTSGTHHREMDFLVLCDRKRSLLSLAVDRLQVRFTLHHFRSRGSRDRTHGELAGIGEDTVARGFLAGWRRHFRNDQALVS